MSRYLMAVIPALLAAGCAQNNELMPMKVGMQTGYIVTATYPLGVETVRVSRELPVAGTRGFELTSGLGSARLAWKDGILVADSTANGRFSPPIPLLDANEAPHDWHGRLEIFGQEQPASAKLVHHKKERIQVGSRLVTTVRSELAINLPKSKGTIVVDSWFQRGVGLVQQEQRTNGVRVVQLKLLTAP